MNLFQKLVRTPAPHLLLAVACLSFPSVAAAAPFCVAVQGLNPQCIYTDPASCETRANQLRGSCISNQAELLPATGPGRFCLVVGNQAVQCIYTDRTSCSLDAIRHKTACVEVTGRPGTSEVDPYALRRPY